MMFPFVKFRSRMMRCEMPDRVKIAAIPIEDGVNTDPSDRADFSTMTEVMYDEQ